MVVVGELVLGGVEPEAMAMLDVRRGWLVWRCVAGALPEEKRSAMHCSTWLSRIWSPGGSSVPQTGHSSSSLTFRRGLDCGGGVEGPIERACSRNAESDASGRVLLPLSEWRYPVGREESAGMDGGAADRGSWREYIMAFGWM